MKLVNALWEDQKIFFGLTVKLTQMYRSLTVFEGIF